MTDPNKHPKLRWPIDISMQEIDGEKILVIRDPLGISPSPLALKSAIAPVIGIFDGNHSTEAILNKFSPHGLTNQLLSEIILILDTNLFLESANFAKAKADSIRSFEESSVRAASNLGPQWGAAPYKLKELVDSHMSTAVPVPPVVGSICGLIAPHIDYHRGGISYGLTYRHLKNSDHTHYIIFGTAHQYSPRLFHLTKKHFDTPMGLVQTDQEFVTTVANKFGIKRSFQDEFLHKQEHSLELQLPFLWREQDAAERKSSYKQVPILVGNFHHMLEEEKFPEEFEEYESFVAALTETTIKLLNDGHRLCLIGAVDMAHIGRAFGDPGSLSKDYLEKIAQQDRVYLDCIKRQDKRGLFAHMAEDRNARKVCGFPSLYTMIDLMDRVGWKYAAHEFDYRQAVDLTTDCAVTFAGIGLYN